jgi:hypothetical protein
VFDIVVVDLHILSPELSLFTGSTIEFLMAGLSTVVPAIHIFGLLSVTVSALNSILG